MLELTYVSYACNLIKNDIITCYKFEISGIENISDIRLDRLGSNMTIYQKLEMLEEYIRKNKLYFYKTEFIDLTSNSLIKEKSYICWIYKYPHQGRIIEKLDHIQDDELELWIIEKLIGVSDKNIENYFEEKNNK